MQLDTTKEAILKRVQDARNDARVGQKGGSTKTEAFRLAFVRFILDAAEVKDVKKRAEAWKQVQATTSSFGTNLSGYEQDNGLRTAKDTATEFGGTV